MTPDERSLLERTAVLAEENNKMLRSIKRNATISTVMRAAYWAVIILLSFGAYYFIQPYVNTMTDLLNGDSSNSAQNSAAERTSLLNSLLK